MADFFPHRCFKQNLRMPQEFQVLQCYSCETFQVHQVKKALKWNCKLCGEKQSIKKVYGRGTGADCRNHVQRLNTMRGEMADLKELVPQETAEEEGVSGLQTLLPWEPATSKWNQFQEVREEVVSDNDDDTQFTTDSNHFRKQKQALKRKKKNVNLPVKYSKLDRTSPVLATPSHQDGIPDQELWERNGDIHQNYTTTTSPIQQPDPCSKNLNRSILYNSNQFKNISPIDIKFSDSYESEHFQKTFPRDTSVSNLYKGEQINKSSKGDGSIRISNSNKDAQSSGVDSKWGRYMQTKTMTGSELKNDDDYDVDDDGDEFDEIGNKYCYKDDQESSDNDNVDTSIYCEDSINHSPKMPALQTNSKSECQTVMEPSLSDFQTLKYYVYNHPEQRYQSSSTNYQQGKPSNLVEKIALESHRNQSSIGIQTTKDKMTPVSRKSNVVNLRQKENSDSKWSKFLNQHKDEDTMIDLEDSDNVESRVVALDSCHERISTQKNVKSQELAGGYKLSAEVMFKTNSENTGDKLKEANKIHFKDTTSDINKEANKKSFKDTTSDINKEVTSHAKFRFGYSDRQKESERKSSPTIRIPQRHVKENISVFSAGELTEDDFDL